MMLVDWLQVGSGEWSNYHGMEEDRPSSRGKAGTSKVVEEKDKRMKTKMQTRKVHPLLSEGKREDTVVWSWIWSIQGKKKRQTLGQSEGGAAR